MIGPPIAVSLSTSLVTGNTNIFGIHNVIMWLVHLLDLLTKLGTTIKNVSDGKWLILRMLPILVMR